MRIQVVERAICLLAPIPPALVHSLDFFIATTWPLVLLSTRNRDEGIDLGKRVRILCSYIRLIALASKGSDDKPGQDAVPRSLPPTPPTLLFRESCKNPGGREGVAHTVAATQDDHTFVVVDGLGIATCRDLAGRTVSKDRGRWDSTRLWMDL